MTLGLVTATTLIGLAIAVLRLVQTPAPAPAGPKTPAGSEIIPLLREEALMEVVGIVRQHRMQPSAPTLEVIPFIIQDNDKFPAAS